MANKEEEPLSGKDVAKRLARIAGHAKSLKELWEKDKDHTELLTQISAVRAALDQVGRVVLEHQLERALKKAGDGEDPEASLRDLKKSLSRLL